MTALPQRRMPSARVPQRALALLVVLLGAACHQTPPPQGPQPPPPAEQGEPAPVRVVETPLVIAAWAEPRRLPPGGGEAQILIRVQKPGGKPFKGVEVRLATSEGTLFSAGRVLRTDRNGMTRDRLTTHKTATITLNAGGTRYRFPIPVEKRTRR